MANLVDYDPNNIALNPKQELFFSAATQIDGPNDYDEFGFFGGFGCGKSFAVSFTTIYLVSKYPGMEWLYLRFTYQELSDSVIPQFIMFFPPDIWGYRYYREAREMRFNNGSVIKMRAFDKDTKILSNQYHGASICQAEEIPKSTIDHLWGRIRYIHPKFNKKVMLLEGNPAPGWAKERYKDPLFLPKNIFFLEATTHENDKLPDKEGYIANLTGRYSEEMIRRFLYSEWETYSDRVFSDFNEKINVIEPFPMKPWYFTAMGGDYGWQHPTVFLWGSVDEFGSIIIWDEYYERMAHFEKIGNESKRHGTFPVIFDYGAKRADRDGKSVWTELEAMGVPLIEASKDELRDIVKINQMFKNCKLYITKNCVETRKEVRELRWKRRKIEDGVKIREEVVDKDNDTVDALRYLVAYIEDLKSQDPNAFDYKKSLEYKTITTGGEYEIYIGR